MDLAARASAIGGEKLTNQTPEEARMNLVMGYANLALAGLDGLQSLIKAMAQRLSAVAP